MIDLIARYVGESFRARGIGVPVTYADRLATEPGPGCRVVIARPREATETITPQGRRLVPGVLTVYAQATTDGATTGDHERLCDAIANEAIAALRQAAKRLRLGAVSFTAGGLLPPADGAIAEQAPSVAWRVGFVVPWRIPRQRPCTVEIAAVDTITKLARPDLATDEAPNPTEPGEPPY